MEKNEVKNLNIDIYKETLENGLSIYISKIDRSVVHARMTVFFGGKDLNFKIDNQNTQMPAGIAHFLEHKMFEKEDGIDPLKIYEKNGASGNAFTTSDITAYHFTGIDNFYENLETLLNCVHKPYFTDENVQKEKGIISQEKKQDLDNPFSIIYDKVFENTFKNKSLKSTVLGSLENISSITKENLYTCYNAFYQPKNMVLTISGNVDVLKTVEFVKNYYKNNTFDKKIAVKEEVNEKETVDKEFEVIYKDVQNKNIAINYKVKKPKIFESFKENLFLPIYLNIKFGGLSDIIDIIQKDENIVTDLNCNVKNYEDYYVITFEVAVKEDTENIINLIDSTLKNKKIDEKTFDLIKKQALNSLIIASENPTSICSEITRELYIFKEIKYDIYDITKSLKFEDLKEILKKLNFENKSTVILEKASTQN